MKHEKVGLLHEQFVRQAAQTPSAIAVVSPEENEEVTFGELNSWTDILAANLQAHGVHEESIVGIFLEKGIKFASAYIAILKAGGAYLPIDTSYPAQMLESVINDSLPTVIIADPELELRLTSYSADKIVSLADGWQMKMEKDNEVKQIHLKVPNLSLDSLAYTVYSSGTTGKPKGILCPQNGAVFSYHHRHVTYPYEVGEREACNIFFVWEMLRPLMKGVPMYIISNQIIYDPPLLCAFLMKHRITRMLFTPSLLETVINTTPSETLKESFKSFRQIWFCGEVVTTSLLARCINLLPWIRFINLYSISECHDVACEDLSQTYFDNKESVMSRKFCPVGRIMKGVSVTILDKDGKSQPVGMSGEIYISGPALARGYLNRPEIQQQRFIESGNKRMYRTGDWGYMLSDGSLEICGRVDTMVKIRGYSIEVQAVESCLLSLPMVKACVVLVCGEEGEDKFMVAYIVNATKTSRKEIRAELKKRLPFFMIPSYFLFLQSIPVVAATGKLDKSSLPSINTQETEDVGAEGKPSTVTEIALAEIWMEVLQLKEVDIQESFFDLGGHSLMATELLLRAKRKFKVELAVRDLFQSPTVSSLAKLVDCSLNEKHGRSNKERTASEDHPEHNLDLISEVRRHDQGVTNMDMQLRAFWRTFHHGHHFNRGRVLLTGATGFLGAFILRELLLHTKLVVYCLVREFPQSSASERIRDTLRQYGIIANERSSETSDQSLIEEALQNRTTALKGNISLMRLGLNEDDYTYLCTDTDFIIHAAASVNLAYPYSALHGANVMGTANVIQFATTGKVKAVHYISTTGVFPHGLNNCNEDDDINDFAEQLTDGYSQSKWVAEQLVTKARDRGLPVTIYRLGNLSGDSKKAFWNPQDLTLLILQACAKIGFAPDVDWDLEFTPVDFVAAVVVKLTQSPDLALGRTLHVVNDKPITAKKMFHCMNNLGYPLQFVKFEDWKTKMLEELPSASGSHDPNAEMMAGIFDTYVSNGNFLSCLSTFNNDSLKKVLTELGMSYPYTDTKLLHSYLIELSNRGLMRPKHYKHVNQVLLNKVAVVTGASSGIGKTIALTLAAAGAKVALAARRIDLIQETVKSIKEDGGQSVGIKTDVTDRAQMKALVSEVESVLGPVDILVNNAGVMYYTLMRNLHEDEWETQINVNCKGVINGIGAVLEGMLKRGKGHIVNITSDAGKKGFPGLAVYSGTKFFVEGMSQALRHEVAGSGIRVTCIQPGDVKTGLVSYSTDKEAVDAYDGSGKCKILDPADIAHAIVYAVSQPDYVAVNEILIEPRQAPV